MLHPSICRIRVYCRVVHCCIIILLTADSVLHVSENDRPSPTVLHTMDAAVVVDSCDVCCHHVAEDESSQKFIRSLPSPIVQPLPDCLPFSPGRGDRLRIDRIDRDCGSGSGEWSLGDNSEDGRSTTSSERVLEQHDKKTEFVYTGSNN